MILPPSRDREAALDLAQAIDGGRHVGLVRPDDAEVVAVMADR